MQDVAGDVGIVSLNLAPALRAGIRSDAHETDILITESLDPLDLHGRADPGWVGTNGTGWRFES